MVFGSAWRAREPGRRGRGDGRRGSASCRCCATAQRCATLRAQREGMSALADGPERRLVQPTAVELLAICSSSSRGSAPELAQPRGEQDAPLSIATTVKTSSNTNASDPALLAMAEAGGDAAARDEDEGGVSRLGGRLRDGGRGLSALLEVLLCELELRRGRGAGVEGPSPCSRLRALLADESEPSRLAPTAFEPVQCAARRMRRQRLSSWAQRARSTMRALSLSCFLVDESEDRERKSGHDGGSAPF